MEAQINCMFVVPTLVMMVIYEEYRARYRFLFCSVLTSTYLHYGVFNTHAGNLFLLLNWLMHIKQRHYIKRISFRTYKAFMSSLKTIQWHSEEIRCWNQFFNPIITIVIVCFTFCGCSLLHDLINLVDTLPFYCLPPWVVAVLVTLGSPLIYTNSSSVTMILNQKLYSKLIDFQRKSLNCKRRSMRSIRRIVQFDLVNEYKLLLLKTCFRLVTSSPINNKLYFFQIFAFVSFVWMKTMHRPRL